MSAGRGIPLGALGLLGLLTIFWGINWPIMKIGLEQIPPFVFRGICAASGAAGMFLIARASGQRLSVPRRERLPLVAAALLNMTGWNILILYGIDLMASGRAAILAYTMPLWASLLGALVLKEAIGLRASMALGLGLAGVALLFLSDERALAGDPWGPILVLGAALSWGAGTVVTKATRFSSGVAVNVAWQHLIGGLPIVAVALVWDLDNLPPLAELRAGPLLCVAYNMIVTAILCYWAYFRIVAQLPVVVSTVGTLLVPCVGVLSGALWLGEAPGLPEWAALGAIMAAVLLVLTRKTAQRSGAMK